VWLTTRYYDPAFTRFLQPDPSSQDGVRSYTYAHDDPVDLADPSGLEGMPLGEGVPFAPGEGVPSEPVGGAGAGAGGPLGAGYGPIESATGAYQQLPLFDIGEASPTEATPDLADPVAARFGFDKAEAYARAKAAQLLLKLIVRANWKSVRERRDHYM
jgi:uncharacterized protein RhaS with RHS repeats